MSEVTTSKPIDIVTYGSITYGSGMIEMDYEFFIILKHLASLQFSNSMFMESFEINGKEITDEDYRELCKFFEQKH